MYDLCLRKIEKKWWPKAQNIDVKVDNGKEVQKVRDEKIELGIYETVRVFPKIENENDLEGFKVAVETAEKICSELSKIPIIAPSLFSYLKRKISKQNSRRKKKTPKEDKESEKKQNKTKKWSSRG